MGDIVRFLCFRITSKRALALFFATVLFGILCIDFLGEFSSKNVAIDNFQRIDYLRQMGLNPVEEAYNLQEFTIPNLNSADFKKYNNIQNEAGYDLTGYIGKTANVYTYRLLNSSGNDTDYFVNLIVCDDIIIGGDITLYNSKSAVYPLKKEILNEINKTG